MHRPLAHALPVVLANFGEMEDSAGVEAEDAEEAGVTMVEIGPEMIAIFETAAMSVRDRITETREAGIGTGVVETPFAVAGHLRSTVDHDRQVATRVRRPWIPIGREIHETHMDLATFRKDHNPHSMEPLSIEFHVAVAEVVLVMITDHPGAVDLQISLAHVVLRLPALLHHKYRPLALRWYQTQPRPYR